MSRRGIFSLINVLLLAAALALLFLYPQYAVYAIYAIVGWFAAGITLGWSGWTGRPSSTGPGPAAPGGPLASGAAPGGAAAPPIDFCIFCGTRFSPGARTCGACGRPLPGGTTPG